MRSVTLVRPRLYGSYRDGRLSFGSLDKVLFGREAKQPFRLPDLHLKVVDGRALIESGFGPVGVKLAGEGRLRGGFSGTLAAIAPRIEAQGCRAERATIYGAIRISGEKPRFSGPLRLARLDCPRQRLALAGAGLQLDATFDPRLDGAEGRAALRSGGAAYGDSRLAAASGTARLTWRKGLVTARYDVAGRGVAMPQAGAASLTAAGVLRRSANRLELEGEIAGTDMHIGSGLDASLAAAQRSAAGTLGAPLLAQLRAALRREGAGSRLTATHILRRTGKALNLVVPQAMLRGAGGEALVSLSRFQVTSDGAGTPRLAGNFATGGTGLPQIAGRLERQPGGRLVTRITMAEYRALDARMTARWLTLVQLQGGALGFAGEVQLSGALPGGRAENLVLPLKGSWTSERGLTVWRDCTTLRFDRLTLANLTFDRRAISVCPPRGGAIVSAGSRGLRVAAGTPALDLSGRLGATPIRLRSGPVGFAMPGTLAARALDVALGPRATASHFRIANLAARVGGEVVGRFSGAEVRLNAVPLDILEASGEWRFAGGKLTLTGGRFRLADRQADARFQPLVARDGTLRLVGDAITASATLREPASDREVVRTAIRHDLASGRGHADLTVPGVLFDRALQPDTLTRLALGVVANASGTVSGTGRVDWTPSRVTSSGDFTTGGLDFAAVFGPVKGAAGTVHFTDLLGLVSAPDQQLRVASVNPGIEVNDGVLTFALRRGSVLAVEGATWPFLGGTLTLRPVTMRLGVAETRRYELVIAGLDAARFVERMELANLTATGTFDGVLPLVFDENGGRIDGGQLRSRPPGGAVSYVGELTYKDLSPMGNFAFDALRALDYRDMAIMMNGPLAGEIVTRVQLAGLRQGEGAKRNFITKRIARLPIQLNVNVRAPFFQLASSFKSLYDPAYVRDPRTLGLIDAQGRPMTAPTIQPPESGKLP